MDILQLRNRRVGGSGALSDSMDSRQPMHTPSLTLNENLFKTKMNKDTVNGYGLINKL